MQLSGTLSSNCIKQIYKKNIQKHLNIRANYIFKIKHFKYTIIIHDHHRRKIEALDDLRHGMNIHMQFEFVCIWNALSTDGACVDFVFRMRPSYMAIVGCMGSKSLSTMSALKNGVYNVTCICLDYLYVYKSFKYYKN